MLTRSGSTKVFTSSSRNRRVGPAQTLPWLSSSRVLLRSQCRLRLKPTEYILDTPVVLNENCRLFKLIRLCANFHTGSFNNRSTYSYFIYLFNRHKSNNRVKMKNYIIRRFMKYKINYLFLPSGWHETIHLGHHGLIVKYPET